MKIVVSVGGSVLARTLVAEKFIGYASAIKEISRKGSVFIVTGGGLAARNYIAVARELGADEASCDLIGIELTRLNARLLISALGDDAYYEPPLNYKEAKNAGLTGKIVVMGGVTPGQTTDAVSAILAEYIGADLLVNATSLGMTGKEELGISLEGLSGRAVVSDIVYTPLATGLIKKALSRGLKTHNGLSMLVRQGAITFELWTGRRAPLDVMKKAALAALGGTSP